MAGYVIDKNLLLIPTDTIKIQQIKKNERKEIVLPAVSFSPDR